MTHQPIHAAHCSRPAPDKSVRSSQPLHVAQIADALLTLRTASAVAGLSPATIYRRAKTDPSFPKLIRMGARCTRIRAGDLTAWLVSKTEAA